MEKSAVKQEHKLMIMMMIMMTMMMLKIIMMMLMVIKLYCSSHELLKHGQLK